MTPSPSSVRRERSSGQKRSQARRSVSIRLCSSGIVEVAAAEPSLDVCERDRRIGCGARAGERRVRVAVDEDEVGRLGSDPLRDRRLHRVRVGGVEIEAVARLGEAELVEEDLGHRVEPVLAGVQHDLVDPGLAKGGRQRRRLDELRTVSDDGEDLHATKPTNVSVQGRRKRTSTRACGRLLGACELRCKYKGRTPRKQVGDRLNLR